MSNESNQAASSQSEAQQEFNIVRVYAKDVSYESPNSPDVFNTEWKPQVDLNLQTDSNKLSDDMYEVVVHATVTVKLKDKTAFLVEVKQAGIFILKNFTDDQIDSMLGSFCPNILFPYARELVSETICRGGFPPLYLAPVNFDAYYQEQLMKRKTKVGH